MRIELVSIATDTAPLDGLYYEPQGREEAVQSLVCGWLTRTLTARATQQQ